MFEVSLSEDALIADTATSEGTQKKYRSGEYWYKLDSRGQEGLAEYLVSHLLKFSSLDPAEYIVYEQGIINQKAGCRSVNFLQPGEELITFYRLYFNEFGKDLSRQLALMESMEERIRYTVDFVRQTCGIDVTDYLRKVITLDRIVLNEDRHLNNLALISDGNNYRPAPVFDQGISLLTANQSVNWNFPVAENVRRVVARPFSGSFDRMYEYFGNGITFDVDLAMDWLRAEPESREKEVLIYQLTQHAVAKRGRTDGEY